MYKGEEKRQHKRVRQPFVVEFRVKRDKPSGDNPGGWDMVGAQDLGAGGVLFKSRKKLETGTVLDFTISLYGFKAAINCTGKVIRVDELSYSHMFLIAAVFTDIGEKEKKMIDKVADDFYPEKLQ